MPVQANMTHIFQPLDLTVNRCSKAFLHKNAQDWYSNEIRKEMEVDVCISVLKPLHASWVTTLKEETFAGRNFRGSEKPRNIYISRE